MNNLQQAPICDRREVKFFFNHVIPPRDFIKEKNIPKYPLYCTLVFDRGSIYVSSRYSRKYFNKHNVDITSYSYNEYDKIAIPELKKYLKTSFIERNYKLLQNDSVIIWSLFNLNDKVIKNIDIEENADHRRSYLATFSTENLSDKLIILAYEMYRISRNNFLRLSLVTQSPVLLYTLHDSWSKYTRIFCPDVYLIIERFRGKYFFQSVLHVKRLGG